MADHTCFTLSSHWWMVQMHRTKITTLLEALPTEFDEIQIVEKRRQQPASGHSMRGPCLIGGGADGFQRAIRAFWFTSNAYLAPVMNDLMGERDPAVFGDDLHQILLDLFGLRSLGKMQASRDAKDMGVNNNAFCQAVSNAQHNAGGLAG